MSASGTRAARLLERLFASLGRPFAVRLWDGSSCRVGSGGEPAFVLVLRSRRTFRRLLLRPSPYRFGVAYVAGELDIEGDLFEAMRAGQGLEDLRWPLRVRLAALLEALRP